MFTLEVTCLSLEVKGIIPAMVTPLNNDEELDEDGLRELVNYLIDSGVHGVFVCGSQGEFFALEKEEKKRAIKVTVDEANGRVPVYAGTGDVTTRSVIELSRYAEDVGADAVSVVTPFFIRPTQEELFQHYENVAEAVDIPVLLYNNPGRTGVDLSVPTVARLAEIDNIVGIKDSSGDLTLTAEYIRSCPDDFAVIAGRDSLILATLVYGGKGAIAATANVVPKIVVGIYESFIRGDIGKARELQFTLLPLRLAFGLGTFPIVVKEAMNILGKPAGPAKSPVTHFPEESREKLKSILRDLEF
ncbi:MAG: 4-hydroxy-tetrahydrodipicolinate synthase [Candidatus Bathyarchaeota archaeon]|nr:4-hydroxy-tetrahydrodipicolinate synthase [Candidatus Bathyarchaeota archaeon]